MKRPGLIILASAALAFASPAFSQAMDPAMPGMKMPAKPASTKVKPSTRQHEKAQPAKRRPSQTTSDRLADASPPVGTASTPSAQSMEAMPGMDMSDMAGMDGMKMDSKEAAPVGSEPPPAVPKTFAADGLYSPGEMKRTRNVMFDEHGGGTFYQIMFNLAELQIRDGKTGYRWDGEGWFGGDLNRFVLKSEGEGDTRKGIDSAEVQALYSRAVNPYWNLQGGVRHDFKPGRATNYATIGIEGLAPYWFEVEGALFLSNQGDVLGRAEAYYDQRLTQRLILQPRAELNFSAQNIPENRLGSGLTNAELGLRLRYEVTREFAPYIGVSYDRKTGDTARYSRIDGESPSSTTLVVGVRTWF